MSDDHDDSTGTIDTDAHGKPRPDDSPPQDGLILLYTLLVVGSLVGLKFVFDSFLEETRSEVQQAHLDGSVASERLSEHRERVLGELNGGEMPIDQAITQLAERGRGAFPQVRPYPSEDRGAREGWSRRAPSEVPAAPEPDEATGRPTR